MLNTVLLSVNHVFAGCQAIVTTQQSGANPNVMLFTLAGFNGCLSSNTTNSIIVNWGDGSSNFFSSVSTNFTYSKTYYQQGTFSGTVIVANGDTSKTPTPFSFTNVSGGNGVCCKDELVVPGLSGNILLDVGIFKLDILSGKIVFESNQCPVYSPYTCLSVAPKIPSLEGVVSASATILDDTWPYFVAPYIGGSSTPVSTPNDYEQGIKNKWRPKEIYTYREHIDQSIINSSNNYEYNNFDRGTFTYIPFSWERPAFNDQERWVKTNQINVYSPNGNVLEDENIMGVKSTAIYGYNNTLQTAVAQNASYRGILFESFERDYPVPGESYRVHDNFVLYDQEMGVKTNAYAHTGEYSIELFDPVAAGNKAWSIFEIGSIKSGGEIVASEYFEHGAVARVWVKETNPNVNFWDTYSRFYMINYNVSPTKSTATRFQLKAQCGEWELYEAYITPAQMAVAQINPNDLIRFSMYFEFDTSKPDYFTNNQLYIDDVRVQPASSSMTCYVYDEAQRLVANFDDQHYALIYQYNEAGELIRKLKETKEGIRTITETRYNSKGQNNW